MRISWLWSAVGAPALITVWLAVKNINKRRHLKELDRLRGRDPSSAAPEAFVCQRVCTSKRMLAKVGAFSKDPTPDTCVVACGVSEVDACADACARAVCAIPHHVPAWNDVCMRRCQEVCLKDNERRS